MAKASQARKIKSESAVSGVWSETVERHGALRNAKFSDGRFHLALESIERLKERGFTNDEVHRIVAPRRTLARRKVLQQELTASESDRVLRLERISTMADRVFADHDKAQRWLRKRSRVLNQIPIELLQSETGATLVEEELHRIDYGIFS